MSLSCAWFFKTCFFCNVVIVHACILCVDKTKMYKCLIQKKFQRRCMYSYSHNLFWVLSPACSLLPNWNALLKHFNLPCETAHSLDVLILDPSLARESNPFVLESKDFSLLSLCETFVSGGFFTLFHCSIPRARNPGNHHTRESLKGLFCVHFSLYQTLSTLSTLSLSLSLAIVSFQCFVVYIIISV
jgi:hypothetical protein